MLVLSRHVAGLFKFSPFVCSNVALLLRITDYAYGEVIGVIA